MRRKWRHLFNLSGTGPSKYGLPNKYQRFCPILLQKLLVGIFYLWPWFFKKFCLHTDWTVKIPFHHLHFALISTIHLIRSIKPSVQFLNTYTHTHTHWNKYLLNITLFWRWALETQEWIISIAFALKESYISLVCGLKLPGNVKSASYCWIGRSSRSQENIGLAPDPLLMGQGRIPGTTLNNNSSSYG